MLSAVTAAATMPVRASLPAANAAVAAESASAASLSMLSCHPCQSQMTCFTRCRLAKVRSLPAYGQGARKLYRRLARVARPVTQAEGLIERARLLLKLFVFSETNTIIKQHDRQSIIGDVLLRLELLAIFHRLLKEWEGFRRLSILQKESPYTPMGLYAEIHRAKSKRLDRCTNLVLAFAILGSRFSASWNLERDSSSLFSRRKLSPCSLNSSAREY